MRVAYVDHSFHLKTNSTRFFPDLFLQGHEVKDFPDDSWKTGDHDRVVRDVLKEEFDLIVIFQSEWVAQKFATSKTTKSNQNILFIPMWDGCRGLGKDFWADFKSVKIISFSRVLHERLRGYGLPSVHMQYFIDPEPFLGARNYAEPGAFFWWRVAEIGWPQVRPLMDAWSVRRCHLHFAPDPHVKKAGLRLPDEADRARFGVSQSEWFDSKAALMEVMLQHNLFIAPRLSEGIGMAMLEAMAAGMCVIANDAPTMSEYIVPRVNGLLVDIRNPAPAELGRYDEMGRRAQDFVVQGRRAMLADLDRLRDFALVPLGSNNLADLTTLRLVNPPPGADAAAGPLAHGGPDAVRPPKVSVVTVVRNDAEALARTIDSVVAQDYPDIEYVVVDGGSTDATLDVLAARAHDVHRWISEPDFGPFDAMNTAVGLATGDYVIFMNAGDWFHGRDAISRAMRDVPADTDFVIGHHIYRISDTEEQWHQAADFEETWRRLKAGPVDAAWLSGIPGHQATFTRTELLRRHRLDCRYRIAADHEFMYRMRESGARFHHSLETISVYVANGMSARQRSRLFDEWAELATRYGGDAAQRFMHQIRADALMAGGGASSAAAGGVTVITDVAALNDQVAALQGELDRIRRSGSWIITYPLRWMVRRSALLRGVWARIPLPGRNWPLR